MEKNPRTVAAFVRAVNAALKDSIAHPRACVESLRSRDPTVDVDIEYQRMDLVLKELQVTPYVQQNGLSAVDPGKLDRAISAIRSAFNLQAPVPADHVFTERFLPPRSERMPPPVGPLL
jgi:NitT/TauT family transport system substrate-binding protein